MLLPLLISDVNLTNVVSFLQLAQMSTRGDQTCLVYSIDHQTYVDYSIEHQTSVVNSMDTSNFGSLQHRPTKFMFFTVRTNVVYGMHPSNLRCLLYGRIDLM